ncbi:MAG TPA: hypothetical protein VK452_07215 [Dissulfurispiraceae bacterium]|nr:hypothetical protein [Dissulfurispiraceae bacterium]
MKDALTNFKWLVGDRIESVQLETESGAWRIGLQSRATIRIECLWRLFEDRDICSTSLDHGHRFGQSKEFDGIAALKEMGQYPITSVKVRPKAGDLFIKLGTMFELEVISISAGYKPWQITHPTLGSVVVSEGELHKFSA